MSTNLTVDDFDPVVVYSNYDDWATPNPQDHPTWWNETAKTTKSPWHQGESRHAAAGWRPHGGYRNGADGSDIPLHRGRGSARVVQLYRWVVC
jgi:hypothetical protein